MSRFITTSVVGLLLGFGVVNVASAELKKEGNFDITPCFSGEINMLKFDDTHIVWSFSSTGSTRANDPEGIFDMMWQNCRGSGGVVAGKRYLDMWCENLDTEGDKFFIGQRYIQDIASNEFSENFVKLVAGTGKYEGIMGEGENLGVTVIFPEDIPDSFWICGGIKGHYQLP